MYTFPNSTSILTAVVEGSDLYISFKKRGVYKYKGAAEVAEQFAAAQSAGKFFNTQIRGEFESVCVG